MGSPTPAEVKSRLFAEHAALRDLMADVADALAAVRQNPRAAPQLRAGALALCSTLSGHLDYEDSVLAPMLEHADAWGDARCESLGEEHHAQRTIVTALIEDMRLGTREPVELVDEIEWFVRALARDIAEEERVLLAGDVLTDVAVVSDGLDG